MSDEDDYAAPVPIPAGMDDGDLDAQPAAAPAVGGENAPGLSLGAAVLAPLDGFGAAEAHASVEEESFEAASSIDSIKILVTCVLAWAIPGLGHVAAGRAARGALFAVVVLGLFVGGIGLHGKVYRPEQGEPLTYLAAVGAAGVGLPYVVAHGTGRGLGDIRSPSFEYGNTFTLVAGLLNLLIVLDAYDVASGRR